MSAKSKSLVSLLVAALCVLLSVVCFENPRAFKVLGAGLDTLGVALLLTALLLLAHAAIQFSQHLRSTPRNPYSAVSQFGPPKAQAFGFALVFGFLTFASFFVEETLHVSICTGFGFLFLVVTLIFLVIWGAKVGRDRDLAAGSTREHAYEPPREFGGAAPKTTPGSGRIGLDFGKSPHPPESV